MDPSTQSQSPPPPVAKKVEHAMEMFGDVRIGNYYWLRDDSRTDPEVLSYLHEENAYTDSIMSVDPNGYRNYVTIRCTQAFYSFYFLVKLELFAEIRGRIKEEDVSAPLRKGPCYYYKRTLEGKEYVQYCRRLISDNQKVPYVHDIMPTGPEAPPEHVILDVNVKAQHHQYCTNTTVLVALSPNNKLVAYAEDTKGDEIYTAWFHVLGTEQSKDTCLYVEKDDMFSLDLEAFESKKYLFVASESKNTRFNFYLDVSKLEEGLKVLTPSVDGIDTTVSHIGAESSGSEFPSSILGFLYSSLRTPSSVYDDNMKAGISVLKKIDSLISGGGEMGRQWYENGKLLKKKNTFTDFIACAEYLIEKNSVLRKDCIEGRSAGGLLIGAVLNMRPDLCKAAVAGVPFVDVVTTMLDPTIPLTTSEWEEWDDPRKEEFYFYMKSYSPVDNVRTLWLLCLMPCILSLAIIFLFSSV
ncbi:Protease 2 isoform B [Glycine soja]|uniref:Prolyl endopeptidase n=1 Tax=Glycine soja TaxID=3848 RepID=A0A445IU79_GLYSO|nr:Protease 2 isoform A [Glycine soja]RZB89645.1 Protease 2 isoform B [Glycine soja]